MDDQYSNAQASNETAPDAPVGALVVAATNNPGSTIANKFSGCYFVVTGNGASAAWILYNKGGHQIDSGTGTLSGFSFSHDKQNPGNPNSPDIPWTISNCVWTPSTGTITGISGSWSAPDGQKRGSQSGSFEASSGGGIDPETASASASA